MRPDLRALARLAARAADAWRRPAATRRVRSRTGDTVPPDAAGGTSRPYAGDWDGPVRPVHRPLADGEPDPGEIVWTWVPYEEDHRRGKDRPVLVVDRHGEHLLCLMLTSRDRSNRFEQDPDHLDIGTGAWDPRGRPSEVRLDRVVRVLPADVRREGAVLPEDRFRRVAEALRRRRE
ncbi:type II toxin-antitoxin system PemK/MazF family toxin [Kocuria sp. M1R5S2]|uniref:type II toxin-antitoxin system PemK/MazF family toxin n=1 Tax=Kocuria rhizosphaerae TaxID=3376285 RepID=UPI00378EF040